MAVEIPLWIGSADGVEKTVSLSLQNTMLIIKRNEEQQSLFQSTMETIPMTHKLALTELFLMLRNYPNWYQAYMFTQALSSQNILCEYSADQAGGVRVRDPSPPPWNGGFYVQYCEYASLKYICLGSISIKQNRQGVGRAAAPLKRSLRGKDYSLNIMNVH